MTVTNVINRQRIMDHIGHPIGVTVTDFFAKPWRVPLKSQDCTRADRKRIAERIGRPIDDAVTEFFGKPWNVPLRTTEKPTIVDRVTNFSKDFGPHRKFDRWLKRINYLNAKTTRIRCRALFKHALRNWNCKIMSDVGPNIEPIGFHKNWIVIEFLFL